MTDERISPKAALLQHLLTVNGVVTLAALAAIGVALFFDAIVVRIVCGLIAVAAGVYFYAWWQSRGDREHDRVPAEGIGPHASIPEGNMKKLLFDDYQSSSGQYVVKALDETEAPRVVPSSKSARPVISSLRAETLRDMEIPDFFDLDSDAPYTETDPRSEFHSLLNKVLLVMKDVLFAQTVAFFWANHDKKKMVLESMATDSNLFMKEKRFPMEDDLLSQVASTGKPQVVGRVNPSSEKELLRYYEAPTYVKSALGVPVFFMDRSRGIHPVGVIVADSKAEDAFGQETIELLGRFTKLVSALIKSYTDKYDLLLDSELLSSMRRMQDRIMSNPGEQSILDALADEARRLASWDFLTVAMYADDRRGWSLQKVVNLPGLPYVAPDQLVDMHESIVGTVIATNKVASTSDLAADDRHRFHAAEKLERSGSFLCVPVSSMNRCYGALTLESRNPGQYTGSEVETVYRLVESAAASLEVLYMNALVKDHVAVDHLTGALTRKHFMKRMEEEVRRAEDEGAELAYVSVAIDAMEEHLRRYGREGCDAILNETVGVLRAHLRGYDLIGRVESDRLGIALIHTTASDGYLWAEKMRKLVSSHVMTVGARSLSITVSAGVCGLGEGMQVDDLLAGTTQVLGKAMEHGGNLVRVF
jgi:diguanylate cyclase (GGDEF)-like protein